MDYPVSGQAPNTADAMVLHYISGGVAIPAGPSAPLPATTGVPIIVKGTVAFAGTSYAQGKCIGGLVTVATGLVAGTKLTCIPGRLDVNFLGVNATSLQTLEAIVFDGNPNGSTLTDGNTGVIVAADIPKIAHQGSSSNNNSSAGTQNYAFPVPQRVAVDANGNIYFALINTAAAAMTFSAGDTIYWRFEAGL